MNLQEFLSHPDVQLPLSWDEKTGSYDFHDFVRKRFERFYELLSVLDDSPIARKVLSRKSAVEQCGLNLLHSLDHSLNGRMVEAFKALRLALGEVSDEMKRQEASWNCDIDKRLLYRVRQGLHGRLSREQLFHIPFEERYRVPPHRYSILGLPCLYLSGSLYTCWEEMGRPPLHQLHVAAFWLKKSIKMLHLVDRPSLIRPWVNGNDVVERQNVQRDFLDKWISRSLVLWPLIASSSVVVRHRDSPFKPEYVIPQMLLQWVRENGDCDGICYSSSNVRVASTEYPPAVWNYAFPAKTSKPAGWCNHLCSLFKMTTPCGWELLRAAQAGDTVESVSPPFFRIELIEGLEEQYALSEFGETEAKLGNLVSMTRKRNNNGEPDVGDIKS